MLFSKSLVLILLLVTLFGCTSIQPINNTTSHEKILANVDSGDLIYVETVEGRNYEVLVKSIGLKSIKGEQLEIPLNQIKSISKKQVSVKKTAGAILAGSVGYLIIAGLAFVAAM